MTSTAKHNEQFTDDEIIARILAGETPLYEIIIRRYNPFLYRVARGYGYDHHRAEDLLQEAYVNAYFHLADFKKRSSFKTWLTRILLNECYRRKQKLSAKNESTAAEAISEQASPIFHESRQTEKTIMNKELGHVLETALGKIPEEYRMVFLLRELNGLNVAETAEALALSESNVKVRLNRSKKMLRSEIEKMYSPEDIFEFNLVYCDRMVERVMAAIKR